MVLLDSATGVVLMAVLAACVLVLLALAVPSLLGRARHRGEVVPGRRCRRWTSPSG